ncbi:related to Sodium/nucleoside cotransporter [Melanopsichium pennsylvanicum]|uniref:Related to Sodium/nucleoside cotransporter n=2 Tax=Melanopsichium pennsylvanicum TaxID=63383 RepID=A0AAJ5C3V8_9BASI|nr:related to Sodium/nucleoside cotransporter 2 [Melanopsichium pennsylvanicum 4]SNX83026.1 related to Sodium/nucleoside cotransporter [Melanopsichium pennsylvanicum]
MSADTPTSHTPHLAKDVAESNGSHHDAADDKLPYSASDRDIETNDRPPIEAIEPHPQGEPGRVSKLWHTIRTHRLTRIAFDFALIGLILGWWLPGIIRQETRHRWVITTFWSWFFILLILFHNDRYLHKAPVANAIESVWTKALAKPWSKIPHYGQIGLGWLALLALYFGSAFGIKEVPESRYGDRARSLFGLFLINCIFYAMSSRRASIKLQPVMAGLGLQMIIGLLVFKTGAFYSVAKWLAFAASDLLAQGQLGGAAFFWGDLASKGYFFIDTLSSIIFFVALVVLLSYLGVMSWAVRKFAWFFFKLMGISGAEAVVAAASPFIGQGENAVLVQSFLDLMTNAELFQVLTSGFSTIAGSVFLAYVQMGVSPTHLITASVMSIPASIAAAKMVVPETETPVTAGSVNIQLNEKSDAVDPLHAFANGAWLGVRVAALIFCNVLCIVSLLYAVNGLLTYIGHFWTIHHLTLTLILGYVLYPFCWCMGVPKNDLLTVSQLLATKIVANEFVAYSALAKLKALPVVPLSDRSILISNFMLAGFGNIGSLGINIGVLSGLAPNRGGAIARLAPLSLITGILVTCSSACIAGVLGTK